MHLLITNIFFDPFSYGGATVVAEEVLREISKQTDWKITVISTSADLDIPPYQFIRTQGAGATHFIISRPLLADGAASYINSQIEAVFSQLLENLAPDIIHAHCMQHIGVGGLREAVSRNIPLIISTHDFWWLCEHQFMITPKGEYCHKTKITPDSCRVCVHNIGATRARDKMLREVLAQADVITYPSEFSRTIHEASGLQARSGKVWPNGVNGPAADYVQRRDARRVRDPRTAFGFVGGPSQIKGWPVIKQAFSLLDRDDFVVNLVDASHDQSWWSPTDFHGLPGEWRILPRYNQSNLDDFYHQVDVLLFLSQWKETFGLSLREAAARGLTIVQTEGGGTVEYDGIDHAHLVQIGDGPQIVADRLQDILASPRPVYQGQVRSYAEQARQMIDIIHEVRG